MIRINLLPPEFRKRQGTGVSMETLGFVAGVVAAGLAIGFWAWITYVRIPAAETLLSELEDEFAIVQEEADEVRALQDEIAKAEARFAVLENLIVGKMRWAATINDFAYLLADNEWSVPGFQVACKNLTIEQQKTAPAGRGRSKKVKQSVQFSFRWEMQLVGRDFERSGDYVSAFFNDVKSSNWWYHHGFVGEPVEPYKGDKPSYQSLINRTEVSHSLLWVRDKDLQAENRAVAAEQAEAQAAEQGDDESAVDSESRTDS